MRHPTAEDFAAWRDNPVTQWVMRALLVNAELNRDAWMAESWETGKLDQVSLIGKRMTAQVCTDIVGMPYEHFLSWNETDEETAAREGAEA